MKLPFSTGDKVTLASGGPVMTIRGCHYDVYVNQYNVNVFDCIWFEKNKDGKDEVHYSPFNADDLVKIKSADA